VSLETPRYKLYSALEALRGQWDHARDHWQDAVRKDFEEHYWKVLEPTTLAVLAAIDGLAQAMRQARRECS
jgi:hypothetical protein